MGSLNKHQTVNAGSVMTVQPLSGCWNGVPDRVSAPKCPRHHRHRVVPSAMPLSPSCHDPRVPARGIHKSHRNKLREGAPRQEKERERERETEREIQIVVIAHSLVTHWGRWRFLICVVPIGIGEVHITLVVAGCIVVVVIVDVNASVRVWISVSLGCQQLVPAT